MTDHTEPEFEELRRRMQSINVPPQTPRDEMWAAIRPVWETKARRRMARRFRRRVCGYGLAAAAILVLGLAIGRATAPVPSAPVSVVSRGGDEEISLPYMLAASRHFVDAENVLTSFQIEPESDDVIPLARDLLVTTRLLLDSRLGEDPEIRRMLEDLELVFSQIVVLTPGNDLDERELITSSVEQNTLLPRLQSMVPEEAIRVGI